MSINVKVKTSAETQALDGFNKDLATMRAEAIKSSKGVEELSKSLGKIDRMQRQVDKAMGKTNTTAATSNKLWGGFVVTAGDVWNATKMVGTQLWSMVQAAAEAEKAQAQLARAVTNTGTSWKTMAPAINENIRAAMNLSGIADEDLSGALSTIITKTGDVAHSQEQLQLAMDLSAAGFGDVGTTANIVSKIMNGQYGQLKRLGIVIPEGTSKWEAMGMVQAKVAGQMEDYGETTAGSIAKATNAFDELKEAIGGALTKGGGLATNMSLIAQGVTDMSSGEQGWYDKVRQRDAEALARQYKFKSAVEATNWAVKKGFDEQTTKWMGDYVTRTNDAKNAQKGLSGATVDASKAAEEAEAATKQYTSALSGLQVEVGSVQALTRGATEATLDYKTAVLDEVAADKEVAKLRKEGKTGTEEYARAVIAQTRAHLRARDATSAWASAQVKAAVGTDTLSAADQKLADKLAVASDRVRDLKDRLNKVPASKKTEIKAEIKKAEANVRRIQGQINGLKGKTIPIEIQFTGKGRVIIGGKMTQILVREKGGPVWPGQPFLVGEKGPELFTPGTSGQIHNTRTTKNILGGAVTIAPGAVQINVNGDVSPNAVAREVEAALRRVVRTSGQLSVRTV